MDSDNYGLDIDHTTQDTVEETEAQFSSLNISSPQTDATLHGSTGRSEGTMQKQGIKTAPPEILLEIFEHCVSEPACVSMKEPSTPMQLAAVCQTWRNLALSTPSLWNNIIVDCGDWRYMQQLTNGAHLHLIRSGSLQIYVATVGLIPKGYPGQHDTYPIQNLVGPFAARIRHLALSFPHEWLNTFLQNGIAGMHIQSLETVKLNYQPSRLVRHYTRISLFANAPQLRKFEVSSAADWPWAVPASMFNLPWNQITELQLTRFILSNEDLPVVLGQCTSLEMCALTVIKEFYASDTTDPPITAIPSVRSLTLSNQKDYDYDKYLNRLAFPALENLQIVSSDGKNGGKWSQAQFSAFTSRSSCRLRTLTTTANINNGDIEAVLGDMPSLVELDVLQGQVISASTVRLLYRGLLAPSLEILKCGVDPDMLSDFLDMLDCRYVPRKSRALYRGIRGAVIRCSKLVDGYEEVRERVEELEGGGRNVTVVDAQVEAAELEGLLTN